MWTDRAKARVLSVCLLLGLGLTAAVPGSARITDVFVVPLSHLDIGFTDTPAAVADLYRKDMDLVLRILDNNPHMRWNVESIWQLEQWTEAHTDPADRDRLARVLASGALGLSASYANMHSSLMTGEEMLRMFYPAQRLREAFGVSIETAIMNDVPGFSAYLPQALAESGVKYLIAGTNLGFGGGTSLDQHEMPFYWVGPDGSRVLTWVSRDGYLEGVFHWDLHRDDSRTLQEKLRQLEARGYPYNAVLVLDGYGDNATISPLLSRHERIARWNKVLDDVTIHYGTLDDFFLHMVTHYGDTFPAYGGDWGRTWETTRVSGPWQMARTRVLQHTLPGVEMLAAFSHLWAGSDYPYEALDAAWRRMLLLMEHTGGPDTGWPEYMTPEEVDESNVWKAGYVKAAEQLAADVAAAALGALRGGSPEGEGLYVLLFNPLSWPRRAVVTVPAAAYGGALASGAVRVVEASTGKEVPAWTVEEGLAFYTEDLPPAGVAAYRLEPGETESSPVVATALGQEDGRVVLESPWYRVEIDRETGWIRSLYDRELDREAVNTASRYGFNELVAAYHNDYFLGGSPHRIPASVEAVIDVSRPHTVGVRLVYAAGSPLASTEIHVAQDAKRVEIHNVLDRSSMAHVPYTRHSEHDFFAFPFALQAPGLDVHYQGAAAFQSVRDTLPGANANSIISRAAIDLRDGRWGVTVAHREPFSFSVGKIGYQGSLFLPGEATLFAHVVQKADEGMTSQGVASFDIEPDAPDRLLFSFAFTTSDGPFDPVQATRFGLEWITPVLHDTGPGESSFSGSIVQVDAPNVLVTALKLAESGQPGRVVLRLQEVAGEETVVQVDTAFAVAEAVRATAVEQPTGVTYPTRPLTLTIRPYETVTLLLQAAAGGTAPAH